jgi:hypothetical protein
MIAIVPKEDPIPPQPRHNRAKRRKAMHVAKASVTRAIELMRERMKKTVTLADKRRQRAVTE